MVSVNRSSFSSLIKAITRSQSTFSLYVVAIALGLGAVMILSGGGNPATAYGSVLYGAYGTWYGVEDMAIITSVLLLTGLSVVISFKCNVWNIGAEGQLYMGATGATFVALSNIPMGVPLALVAAFAVGAAWASIAGVLKAGLGVDEIVSTVLMNWIALLLVDYLVTGPWKDPIQVEPESRIITSQNRLPLIPGTVISTIALVAVPLALLLYVLLFKTKWGYEIRLMGTNARAARYAGVNTTKNIILVMVLSGGLAGLAGAGLVMSLTFHLLDALSNNYGYMGVAVGSLAGLHPIASILTAIFFATLDVGGLFMERTAGVPYQLIQVIVAITIVIVLLRGILLERVKQKWH